jgi:hypothetical protein
MGTHGGTLCRAKYGIEHLVAGLATEYDCE